MIVFGRTRPILKDFQSTLHPAHEYTIACARNQPCSKKRKKKSFFAFRISYADRVVRIALIEVWYKQLSKLYRSQSQLCLKQVESLRTKLLLPRYNSRCMSTTWLTGSSGSPIVCKFKDTSKRYSEKCCNWHCLNLGLQMYTFG